MTGTYFFTRLVLVRHAQARATDGTYGPDTPLSPLGLRQAELLSLSFAGKASISAIYCSPFLRAVQTAQPMAGALGIEPIVDGGVAEFQVETAPIAALMSLRADVLLWRPGQRGMDGGESIEEFFVRVNGFCERICGVHRNETVVLVTHAGTIDAVFRWAMCIPPSVPWTFEVEMGNATVSEIEAWPRGRMDGGPPKHAVLHRIGDGRHLGVHESKM